MNKNTALLIIDIVNGTCSQECETPEWGITFNEIREMVPRLAEFIKKYRADINQNIYFINLTPWTKQFLPKNIQKLYEDPNVEYYGEGGFEEEFYTLRPQNADTIITKNTYDAFTNPQLEQSLKERKIDTLIIAGVFTDGCVLSTIISGFSKGYNFFILQDMVETTDLPVRQRLQKDLLEYTLPTQYGKVMTGEQFLNQKGQQK